MSDKKPVVVYGASGYTGRLVCEFLRQYQIPFVAAGRNAEKIQEVMDHLSEKSQQALSSSTRLVGRFSLAAHR